MQWHNRQPHRTGRQKSRNATKNAAKEQEHLAEMQKDLNLNASQVAQIKALHETRKAEMKAEFEKNKEVRQAKMEEMKAKRAQMDADMKKILTLSNMINGRLTEKLKWNRKEWQ